MTPIKTCRLCCCPGLIKCIDLGTMAFTGRFPKSASEKVPSGPLELVMCRFCRLVQLSTSYPQEELYGKHYGYRSSLNKSMQQHLIIKAEKLSSYLSHKNLEVVVDIGSNDGTLLGAFGEGVTTIGFDPSAVDLHYPKYSIIRKEFFSKRCYDYLRPLPNAKIITSIAMFYDLEDPIQFAQDIYDCLDPEGVWHFEQSYLPTMLDNGSYDTICHEHLEYYGLAQIRNILDKTDFKIIEIGFNAINGGSMYITAAKKYSKLAKQQAVSTEILHEICETEEIRTTQTAFKYFQNKIDKNKLELSVLLKKLSSKGLILGYGASTKGNVILQHCGITTKSIEAITDVNQDKWGCFTPGTGIPIISEKAAKEMKPDYFLVLPWHFKKSIIEREKEFLANGGKLIFPLPCVEII